MKALNYFNYLKIKNNNNDKCVTPCNEHVIIGNTPNYFFYVFIKYFSFSFCEKEKQANKCKFQLYMFHFLIFQQKLSKQTVDL